LEQLNVAYTGANFLSLAVTKPQMKALFCLHGVQTPKYSFIFAIEDIGGSKEMNFPIIVKPANSYAS
jgi:D-alanine-D-alanine ligase-like ATP-grasp enzyme